MILRSIYILWIIFVLKSVSLIQTNCGRVSYGFVVLPASFNIGSRSDLRRSERKLGRLRRWIDLQLQSMRRLQSRLSHMLRQSLSAPSDSGITGPFRDSQQISHRQSRQVSGETWPTAPGWTKRTTDGWYNVCEERVWNERKRERKRNVDIYYSDFPNYLLHFTM